MQVSVPQIAWHAREPIQSVDVAVNGLIATAGNDNEVRLWRLGRKNEGLSFVQDLSQHSKPVNVVRFCPEGVTLASAGDDSMVILWKEKAARPAFGDASGSSSGATAWGPICALRGHSSEVYDLAWSPSGTSLFSGAVDGNTIIWDIEKAKPSQTLYAAARAPPHTTHNITP